MALGHIECEIVVFQLMGPSGNPCRPAVSGQEPINSGLLEKDAVVTTAVKVGLSPSLWVGCALIEELVHAVELLLAGTMAV